MDTFLVYLIFQLDSIKTAICSVFVIIASIFILILVISFFNFIEKDKKDYQKSMKTLILQLKKVGIFLLALFIFDSFIPSTKNAIMIYLIPKITHSIETSKLPKLINLYIEKEIKKLENGKN